MDDDEIVDMKVRAGMSTREGVITQPLHLDVSLPLHRVA